MHEPVTCRHCGDSFEPRPDQIGGIVNCARCGKIVQVPGLRDPLWLALRLGVVLVAIAIGVTLGAERPALGIAAGSGTLLAAWLISRLL